MRIDSSSFGLIQKRPGVTQASLKASEDGAAQASVSTALPPPPPPPPASTSSGQAGGEEESAEKTLIEQILDGGFTRFVEEIEAKKKAELREKILKAMGLTEQDLILMPPEQRKLIEQSIESEIKRRMEALAALRKDKNDPSAMPGAGTTSLTLPTGNLALGPQMTTDVSTALGSAAMGLGPLLALQETNEKTGKTTPDDEHPEPEHKAVKRT